MTTETSQRTKAGFQFNLRDVVVFTFLVAVFCMLLNIAQVRIGLGFLLFVAAMAMANDIYHDRVDRTSASCLFAAAVIYGAANLALHLVAWVTDPFVFISPGYILFVVVVCPLMALVFVTVFCFSQRKLHWLAVAGFVTWALGIAAFHMAFIIEAVASV